MKKVILAMLVLIVSGCMTQVELTDSDQYLAEIAKIKDRQDGADFTNLRMVYTNTKWYKPFGGKEKLLLESMFKSLQKNDYEICISQAKEILEVDYTSLNAHYAAMNCNYKMGDRETGAYHKYVLDGLIESIESSGDGESKDTAYIIISQAEMKAFLDLKGLALRKRKLERDKRRGRAYNVMSVTDQAGRRKQVLFDVTLQMARGI